MYDPFIHLPEKRLVQQRRFGRSGMSVPCVGMGTWQTFDVEGPEALASAATIVSEANAAGAGLFDSSPMYGRAESVLGEALGDQRGTAIVATKVWTEDDEQAERQARRSLGCFDGFIDIYQVHNLVSWPQRLELLEQLRGEGRIRLIGATLTGRDGNFDELERAMRTGRFDAIQIPYNPAERDVERIILPLAEDLGIGVIAMRPLGEGRLVKLDPPASALAPLREFGVTTWAQALIKWTISDRRCHTAIPATSRAAAMRENADAGHDPWLDDDARALVARLATAAVPKSMDSRRCA